ncbi:hypothetical protein N656DRAFT_513162 [Canariomyces notabilis]|uniref:Transmembrane protein n=1 Tax=Canariomyces notabilis TaxID=2074819 RepID=A0AAN6T7S4_9PEZI|nr:hypothetical protein N656DRAFT_513162 [Canariomyces arenarius]
MISSASFSFRARSSAAFLSSSSNLSSSSRLMRSSSSFLTLSFLILSSSAMAGWCSASNLISRLMRSSSSFLTLSFFSLFSSAMVAWRSASNLICLALSFFFLSSTSSFSLASASAFTSHCLPIPFPPFGFLLSLLYRRFPGFFLSPLCCLQLFTLGSDRRRQLLFLFLECCLQFPLGVLFDPLQSLSPPLSFIFVAIVVPGFFAPLLLLLGEL